MMLLRRTCREATALLVAREDRRLPWSDRLALRLHLAACQACPRFAAQMLAMRQGLEMWRNYTDSGESGDSGGPNNTIFQKN